MDGARLFIKIKKLVAFKDMVKKDGTLFPICYVNATGEEEDIVSGKMSMQ
jgi:hypothetical protein